MLAGKKSLKTVESCTNPRWYTIDFNNSSMHETNTTKSKYYKKKHKNHKKKKIPIFKITTYPKKEIQSSFNSASHLAA